MGIVGNFHRAEIGKFLIYPFEHCQFLPGKNPLRDFTVSYPLMPFLAIIKFHLDMGDIIRGHHPKQKVIVLGYRPVWKMHISGTGH